MCSSDLSGESAIRAMFSNLFYQVSNLLSDIKIESGVRDFRLMDREVVNAVCSLGEYHRFSKMIFAWVGFRRDCLEFEYEKGIDRASKWSFFKLFGYAIEGIVSFSVMPLKFTFILGFIITFFSAAYGIYIIFEKIFFGNSVPGWSSMAIIILFLGGMQFMFLGIIGEYIAKIYEQVKNRPQYIIDSSEGIKSEVAKSKSEKSKGKK